MNTLPPPRLQVLISTYGADGLVRVMQSSHPAVEGVEYLMSWQVPDLSIAVPDELLSRPDFRVEKSRTRGLSRNRNITLSLSTAPLLLLADDDVSYTAEALQQILQSFEVYPQADILTFRHKTTEGFVKPYPKGVHPLGKRAKGYYYSSIEIAFRAEKIRGRHFFNEHFGAGGAEFCCGEEDLFMHELLSSGLTGLFVPIDIGTHQGLSAAGYMQDVDMIPAKGAVFLQLHPKSWPVYMLAHALRRPRGTRMEYCRLWRQGVRKARELNVFADTHGSTESGTKSAGGL